MKFACPESQKRESLKCGNIASVSALASVGGLGGSFAAGAVGAADCVEADCVESEAACDCVQPAGPAVHDEAVHNENEFHFQYHESKLIGWRRAWQRLQSLLGCDCNHAGAYSSPVCASSVNRKLQLRPKLSVSSPRLAPFGLGAAACRSCR